MSFNNSKQSVLDALEMIAISRELSIEGLKENPSTYTLINTNSPLQYDTAMAEGLIEMARYNQVSMTVPFSVAGASMPIDLANATALANAEMLAGLVLSQLVRPGAAIINGAKTVPVNMNTGSLADASPESNKALQIGAQLSRYYGLPYRSACFTNANSPDAQSGYESQSQLWAGVTAGTNLILHAAGWLETGLCSSFEKFILDIEMLQMMAAHLEPVKVHIDEKGFEEIKNVGPGGHFFSAPSTIEKYDSEFYRPIVFNAKDYDSWQADGGKDAVQRAHDIYKQVLSEYQQPVMGPNIQATLDAFTRKRINEGGSPIN